MCVCVCKTLAISIESFTTMLVISWAPFYLHFAPYFVPSF